MARVAASGLYRARFCSVLPDASPAPSRWSALLLEDFDIVLTLHLTLGCREHWRPSGATAQMIGWEKMRLSYEIQTWDGNVLRAGDPKPVTPHLYRYLPIQHCREFVDHGRVRISRSPTLDDDGLSAGQRDQENMKSVIVHASEVEVPDQTDPMIASKVTELGSRGRERFEVETKLSRDYYLLCLSSDLRADLFDEFPPADAVVEIFNVSRFAKAMRCASMRTFGGQGREVWMPHQPVRYLGEVLGYGRSVLTMSPCFDKHTDFSHQKEHRFTWYPCIFDDDLRLPRLRPDGIDRQGNPQEPSGVG